MISSEIHKIPYKNYGNMAVTIKKNNNRKLILFNTGQGLSGEVFFGLAIYPDGSCLCDRVLEHGYDIAFVDPINYGYSEGIITEYYTRPIMAEQLSLAIDKFEKDYDEVYLLGYCTTANVPLVVAAQRNLSGVVLLSPLYVDAQKHKSIIIQNYNHWSSYTGSKRSVRNISSWATRFLESDRLLEQPLRPANWKELYLEKIEQCKYPDVPEMHWPFSTDMVFDHSLYEHINKTKSWEIEDIRCPIATIRGEFDYEAIRGKMYDCFLEVVKSKLVYSDIIPNSTHFGMWEKNYDQWIEKLLLCFDSLS